MDKFNPSRYWLDYRCVEFTFSFIITIIFTEIQIEHMLRFAIDPLYFSTYSSLPSSPSPPPPIGDDVVADLLLITLQRAGQNTIVTIEVTMLLLSLLLFFLFKHIYCELANSKIFNSVYKINDIKNFRRKNHAFFCYCVLCVECYFCVGTSQYFFVFKFAYNNFHFLD